jgi:hypothetical protein
LRGRGVFWRDIVGNKICKIKLKGIVHFIKAREKKREIEEG